MPKKTRATKKTDIKGNKPWLKKVGLATYEIETIEKKKRFLILCEGQTEEVYFKSFPVITADVEAVHQGCSKVSLIDCVDSYREGENYDEIWCVFDMDFKGDIESQNDDFDKAIRMAESLGYKCAYSNDCFELWFVLHYQYIDAQHLRTTYFQILSDLWKMDYVRNGKERAFASEIYKRLFDDMKANQELAMHYAKSLYKNTEHLPFHQQNPVTKVYLLVEELNSHLRT